MTDRIANRRRLVEVLQQVAASGDFLAKLAIQEVNVVQQLVHGPNVGLTRRMQQQSNELALCRWPHAPSVIAISSIGTRGSSFPGRPDSIARAAVSKRRATRTDSPTASQSATSISAKPNRNVSSMSRSSFTSAIPTGTAGTARHQRMLMPRKRLRANTK